MPLEIYVSIEEAATNLDESVRRYAREAFQKLKASPLYRQKEVEEEIEIEDIESRIRP